MNDYTDEQVAILNAVREERLVIAENLSVLRTLFDAPDVTREQLAKVLGIYIEGLRA